MNTKNINTDQQIVDQAVVDRIARLGGQELLQDMIGLFLGTAPKILEAASAAEKASDLEGIERAVHALKSSAGTLGAVRVYELARTVEALAAKGDRPPIPPLLKQLETSFAQTRARLQEVKGPEVRRSKQPPARIRKRVAVIEDNADNRLLVRAILIDTYEVVEYENGLDALEGMTRQRPHLVLMDISLPGMDGTEVVQRMRKEEHLLDLPVIALTARAMAGDREKFLAAGFNEYITKPILDETILLTAIERLVNPIP